MRRNLNYFKYILRHKFFVFLAGRKIGASVWLSIVHDWTKFLPSEWRAYARTFYKKNGSKQYVESDDFRLAWNLHQKRNKHHWQYWLLTWDRGETEPVGMPIRYIEEMVADWMGAGKAITGRWETKKWYEKNRKNIIISNNTRKTVELILERFC